MLFRTAPANDQDLCDFRNAFTESADVLRWALKSRFRSRWNRQGRVHARERFDDAVLTPFQKAVQELLKQRAGTPRKLSPADRALCDEWQSQCVTTAVVGRAIVLGCIRKFMQAYNSGGKVAMRIYSLKYFQGNIVEAQDPLTTNEYWMKHEQRLKRWESGIGLPDKSEQVA